MLQRPYINFYSPVFILYELSTPFLNIHWFFDKLNMTGSKPQLYNGIALLVTFFSCRLVWGTYQSALVYADMWKSLTQVPSAEYLARAFADPTTAADPNTNPMYFARDAPPIPVALTAVYLVSNLTLNSLNWFWFVKMVAAVRKRFEPPKPGAAAAAAAGKREAVPVEAVSRSKATGLDEKERLVARQRRAPSIIEDVVPDTEELREGTIQ